MTPWLRFWDTLRWQYPWWIIGASVLALLFLATWGTWKLALWWFRRHIRDHVDELARAEIERRDDLIRELRTRLYRIERESEDLRAMVRGAMSLLSGTLHVGNLGATDRPTLRRAK